MAQLNESQKRQAVEMMGSLIPHTLSLGVSVECVLGDELTLRLPYQRDLVGDPQTGTLHGGAITVLLDQTMGLSCVCADVSKPSITPTLDLRIDHLRVAPAGRDILASARIYRATRKVLFAEGFAWCESRDKPIARATGSWVRTAPVDLFWLLEQQNTEDPR